MTDEPLIYTAKGNLPIASLTHEVRWEDSPTQLRMVEVYRMNGEVVRESSYFYLKQGLTLDAETGKVT